MRTRIKREAGNLPCASWRREGTRARPDRAHQFLAVLRGSFELFREVLRLLWVTGHLAGDGLIL